MRRNRIPKYCKHKSSGQGVVRIDGRDIYLGRYNSPDSLREYDRLIAEYLQAGRHIPPSYLPSALAISELLARFVEFSKTHYTKNGRPTHGDAGTVGAIRVLRKMYGDMPVDEFGPLRLKTVRQAMIEDGLARSTVNDRTRRIVRIFSWVVEEELVEPNVVAKLREVKGLQKGRTEARETKKIRPVEDSIVEVTLPHMPPTVRDMVRLQRISGMRPNEVVQVRPGDIDRSGKVWRYEPAEYKTEHHEHCDRVIFLALSN